MDTLELNDLEIQINHLMQAMERLKSENRSLKNKLVNCARERARVQEINQNAIKKVKRIIGQLKDEIS